jgi:transcriptional regulator with XRE-family HTH domain
MPVPFKETTTALQRIDLMMKELEQRKKDLKVAAERRGKLMIYVRHNKLTRADLSSVAYQLPKTRITRKDREANLVKKRARSGKDYPPKAELVPFGKRLRSIIKQSGYTYTEIGKAIGMHGSMIPGWERGQWQIKPDKLKKLEKFLGVSFKDVLPSREAKLRAIVKKYKPRKTGLVVKPELAKFGARLREARTAKGLSAEAVGKEIGKNPSMITAWERGKWKVKPEDLAKLTKLYGNDLLTYGGKAE